MDLAVKDIRRHVGKFVATIVGVGLLLAIVLVMNGIYQGNIADGVWLIENTATDLWVVERGRGGPFNECSRIPLDSYNSVAATPGVAQASPFVIYSAQRDLAGESQQFTIIGYDVFGGLGGPGRIVRGRAIAHRTTRWWPTRSSDSRSARCGSARTTTLWSASRAGRSTRAATRSSTSRCPTRRKCSTSRTTRRSPRHARPT